LQDIRAFLERAGLVDPGDVARFEPLAGGVSSDIWLVRAGSAEFCVKRALDRLRVAADWRADTSRNANEVRWLTEVAVLDSDLVPAVLASDSAVAAFAMEYLPPDRYEPWKAQLARGCVIPETAATVGRQLASIHAAFARSRTAAVDFATDTSFHDLRIEPYLLATARAHPDLASVLEALAERTAQTKLTVVHGDVSPKNILLGARGPVFLDAECAWFGDPAFDLAFCLNHLLLKTLWVPSVAHELLTSFDAMADAYLAGVDWEPAAALEQRTAHLLPALCLARVDGKSPVEYLTSDDSKNIVRRLARPMLTHPQDRLESVRRAWAGQPIDIRRASRPQGDVIEAVIGRRVWDSRGRPTVEAEVVLRSGIRGRGWRPLVRRRALTRLLIFETAAARLAASASIAPSDTSRQRLRARSSAVGDGSGSDRRDVDRAGWDAEQIAAGSKRGGCRVDGRSARRGGAARHTAMASSRRWIRAAPADADGADLRRRRACGPPGRYPGFSRRAGRRGDVRPGHLARDADLRSCGPHHG
jgi:fructosamine-3-kinase